MLYWLTFKIVEAYTYSTLIFLIFRLFNRSVRNKTAGYLNIANAFILVALGVIVILSLLNAYECKSVQTDLMQKNGAAGYNYYYTSNCFSSLIWTASLAFAFHLFFLFRKFRTSVPMTIVSVALLLVYTNLERVIVFITSLFRDYLPSSWSVYYDKTDYWWTLLFSVFYFVGCWAIPYLRHKAATR
jgi:hypothetical protein